MVTGEELCVGQGCAVVGALTRIPPALFNLFGAGVLLLVSTLAFAVRRVKAAPLYTALHVVLTGALGAEGVLFAYQWHVAGAWCLYCLGILTVVVVLNLAFSLRGAVFGLSAFFASLLIFSLLSYIPFNRTLDDGTFAVRESTEAPSLYLIFSEDCPHCHRVLEAIEDVKRCSVRFNPVAKMPATVLPELVKIDDYDPRVNVAAATLLGLRTIPILVAKEPSGLKIVNGEEAILAYLRDTCTERKGPVPSLGIGEKSWFGPSDDGCGIAVDCD
jgi:hypothetical protein